jgi:hypothetical protein
MGRRDDIHIEPECRELIAELEVVEDNRPKVDETIES